jgi:ATP-dependent Lon protease
MKQPPVQETKGAKKTPKRGGPKDEGPKDEDDESMDEHGNVRGLIDYDESDNESDHSELSLTPSERIVLKKTGKLPKRLREEIRGTGRRQAAIVARERIRKKMKKENSRRITPITSSSDSTFEIAEETKRSSKGFKPRAKPVKGKSKMQKQKQKRVVEEEEEEEEDDSETLGSQDTDEEDAEDAEEDEDEDEDDEDENEDEDEDEEEDAGFKGISISFGGLSGGMEESERMIPRRHNMKKETEDVRKFVKLVSKPVEEETIDDQIDQFKSMDASKQKVMLEALEKRSDYVKKEQPLMFRLLQMKLTPETMAMVMNRYNALNSMDPSSGEYYKLRSWMEKLVSIPLGIYKDMPVRIEDGPDLCGPFMEKAKRCLNEAIYGQEDAKLQILQFIASKISNPSASGLSLLLLGPPGIGKTSLIKNGIAKALEWPFQFISLGGDSDATTYTGHQFVYEGSHSGKIANCVAQAKSMSMIMMFDELDKISNTPKGEEVQNLLVHLTDPVQNMDFEDKYLSGIPLDLSRAMFVFSGNDVNKIDKILLDRMVVVNLNGYEIKDKVAIAEQFLLPAALREVNLAEKVAITREILQYILETYAKGETGVRELKRCIEQIAQRVNMLRMFNVKELPFHIPNFVLPFVIKKEHVDLFLKKKDGSDKLPMGMYT